MGCPSIVSNKIIYASSEEEEEEEYDRSDIDTDEESEVEYDETSDEYLSSEDESKEDDE